MEKNMAWSRTAAKVYADGPTVSPFQPPKFEIRPLLKQYEDAIAALTQATGAVAAKGTLPELNTVSASNGDIGIVFTGSDAGVYKRVSGAWVKLYDLPSDIAQMAADEAAADRVLAEEAKDIAAGYASDAVSQGNVPIYGTATGLPALTIPDGINAIRTNGYRAAGDFGGALYRLRAAPEADGVGDIHSNVSGTTKRWALAVDHPTPHHFGAYGDYVNDDAQAIEDASVYAAAMNSGTGGVVTFPSPKGYAFGTPLVIPNTQRWEGAGSTPMKYFGTSGVAVTLIGNHSSCVKMTLEYAGAGPNVIGYQMGNGEQGQQQVLRDCTTNGFKTGFYVKSGVLWRLDNCVANNATEDGFLIRNVVNADSGDGHVTGCCASNPTGSGRSGFRYESGGGLKFIGNKILGFQNGFDLQMSPGAATVDLLFLGNSIENQSAIGVRLGEVGSLGSFGSLIVIGNEVAGVPIGIQLLEGVANGTVTGNTFNVCSDAAIEINSGAVNFDIGPNNYSACAAQFRDRRSEADAGLVNYTQAGSIQVASATVYDNYAVITIPPSRTARINLLIEGVVQGVGFAGRVYEFLATNPGVSDDDALILTVLKDQAIGASADINLDTSVDGKITFGVRRNAAGGGSELDGSYKITTEGRIREFVRLS